MVYVERGDICHRTRASDDIARSSSDASTSKGNGRSEQETLFLFVNCVVHETYRLLNFSTEIPHPVRLNSRTGRKNLFFKCAVLKFSNCVNSVPSASFLPFPRVQYKYANGNRTTVKLGPYSGLGSHWGGGRVHQLI